MQYCLVVTSLLCLIITCGENLMRYIAIFQKKEYLVSKKDTAISFSAEELVLLHLKKDSEGQNYGRIDYGIENIDGLFRRWNCDTVSFFMFDSKVVENNTWEEVVQNYMVLQRYDFSKEDLARLNCQIFYPPTEEMSEIHMFPPYEKVKMR